jgi:mRNA interferase MazF
MAKLKEDCDIMIDQLRSIDNKRLQRKIGTIPEHLEDKVKQNLTIVLDL